jgi:hypothetical protein
LHCTPKQYTNQHTKKNLVHFTRFIQVVVSWLNRACSTRETVVKQQLHPHISIDLVVLRGGAVGGSEAKESVKVLRDRRIEWGGRRMGDNRRESLQGCAQKGPRACGRGRRGWIQPLRGCREAWHTEVDEHQSIGWRQRSRWKWSQR